LKATGIERPFDGLAAMSSVDPSELSLRRFEALVSQDRGSAGETFLVLSLSKEGLHHINEWKAEAFRRIEGTRIRGDYSSGLW
jgi:hypothetical protein